MRILFSINTVANRPADWMDAAHFVLLGFLYEGRARTVNGDLKSSAIIVWTLWGAADA